MCSRTAYTQGKMLRKTGNSRSPSTYPNLICRSAKQGAALLQLRLRVRDLVDQEAHATLRDDVRGAVAALDQHHGLCWGARSMEADQGDDVHHGVGEPADNRDPAGLPDHGLDAGVGLLRGGLLQSEEQLLDDEGEEDEGSEPVVPPC